MAENGISKRNPANRCSDCCEIGEVGQKRGERERESERRNVKAAIAIQSPKDSNDVDKRKKTNASVRNRTLYERECFNFIEKTSTQKAWNRRGAKEDTGREGKKRERERIGPRETKIKATMSDVGRERKEEKQMPRNRRSSAATNEFHSRPTHVNKRKLKKLFM